MYLKLLLLLSLFVSTLNAKTLDVTLRDNDYKLEYSKEAVSIKGYRIDLSFKRTECNGFILDRFYKDVEAGLFQGNLFKQGDTTAVPFVWNSEKYYEPQKTKRAELLHAMPAIVERMKIEEKLLKCSKK